MQGGLVQSAVEATGATDMSAGDDKYDEETSVVAAAASGDKLRLLYALRDRIAEQVTTCPTRDLSPLSRLLRDIVKEIDEIKEREKQENPGDRRSDGDSNAAWTPDENI